MTCAKQHIRLDRVAQFVIQKVNCDECSMLRFTLGSFVFLKNLTSQMVSLHSPNGHVLVTTRNETTVFEWVELKPEHGEVAQISEGECSILLPLKHLDRVAVIHANRRKFFTIWREC
jgi:hypothetical protein